MQINKVKGSSVATSEFPQYGFLQREKVFCAAVKWEIIASFFNVFPSPPHFSCFFPFFGCDCKPLEYAAHK